MTRIVTLKQVSRGHLSRWVVLRNKREIGFIEKFRDTPTDTNPWKAYAGIGHANIYLGCFYDPMGRERAVTAVLRGKCEV